VFSGNPEKELFAAQNIFSTILRLAPLQIKNSPFWLKHLICRRSASPRIVTEKILIRAQSFLFQFSKKSYQTQQSLPAGRQAHSAFRVYLR